jgi:3-hydroxymyristoyl/3-hydroxydecanoyl-(acyl carrier protein) dehydratase
MSDRALFELDDLLPMLPHRPPFLFVDRVLKLEPYKSILAERALRLDEPFFAGHFPNRPIMPGVLVAEALAQTSGLLLGLSEKLAASAPPPAPRLFFLATLHLKYTHPAFPGQVLALRAAADKQFAGLFRFQVEAVVGRNVIASGSLTLAQAEGEP